MSVPTRWGADSVENLDTSTDGTTFANYVLNTYFAGAPHDQIVWWGRYFDLGTDPAGVWDGDSEANALSNAVKGYANPSGGNAWIQPIGDPYLPNVGQNGTYTQGKNSGAYVCGNIAAHLSGKLKLPTSQVLYVYADFEYLTNQQFVDGWANGVLTYGADYWAACYTAPGAASEAFFEAAGTYSLAWTTQPEYVNSTYCASPGPSWAADAIPGITTYVWQYAENGPGACGGYRSGFPCDLDQIYPNFAGPYGNGMCDYMLGIPHG
ncbi:MAG: hypothetical protein ABSB52_15640 [Acidimicrobiales bacterium]